MPSDIELDTIAREIKSWLDWQEVQEGAALPDSQHILSLPYNPTRGLFKAWIKCLSGEELLEEPNIYRRG